MSILRIPLVAAFVAAAAFAPSSRAGADESPFCKNHYILRCEVPLVLEWVSLPAPLVVRGDGVSVTALDDGRALVTGGAGRVAEIFDPISRSWSLAAPMNMDRPYHRAVRLDDGRVLVLGSAPDFHPGTAAAAEVFDPVTGSWTLTAPLRTERGTWYASDLTATLLHDGTVLVTGGSDEGWGALASAEIYDPARSTWEPTGSLIQGRVGHTATLLSDGKVLVTGGVTDWDFWIGIPSAELYDPASRTWRQLPGPGIVNHSATPLADGRVLAAGGQGPVLVAGAPRGSMWPQGTLARTWLYDPEMERWTEGQRLLTPRHNHLAIPLSGNDVLVSSGMLSTMPVLYAYSRAPVNDSEAFNATTGTWRRVEQIGNAPALAASALLRDGSVLVVGAGGAAMMTYGPASEGER